MANKITKLTLGEISEVTKPAQADALATIMKGDSAEIIKTIFDAHSTALEAAQGDADEIAKANAEAKEAIRELCPDAQGVLMEAVDKASNDAGDPPVSPEVSMTDKTEQVAELEKKLADLENTLTVEKTAREDAEVISKMSDAEKSYMSGLGEEKRQSFMKMSAKERADAMKVAKAADDIVTIDGQEIRKSAVGAEMFTVLKAQADRLEAVEKAAAADRDRAEMVELRKRADDEFGNVPGSADAVASLLKAASGFSDEDRATLDGIMKTANEAAIFKSHGHSVGAVEKAASNKLAEAITKVMTEQRVTKAKAMEIVATSNAQLIEEAR